MVLFSTRRLETFNDDGLHFRKTFHKHGYTVVRPEASYDVEDFIRFTKLFGSPIVNSRTNENGVFEVGVGKTPFIDEDVNDTAYAEKHTDGVTFTSNPDISFLRCVTSDLRKTGYNRIYDATSSMTELANSGYEFFAALTRPVIELYGTTQCRPILQLCPNTGNAKFFYNAKNIPDTPIYRNIEKLIDRIEFDRVLLQPGDILIMNNARVMHGREAFVDTQRHLQRIIIENHENSRYQLKSGFNYKQRSLTYHHQTTREDVRLYG